MPRPENFKRPSNRGPSKGVSVSNKSNPLSNKQDKNEEVVSNNRAARRAAKKKKKK